MHRALPVSNKILSKKWEENNHRIHSEKLKNIQPRIKSTKPPKFEHLKFKAKKEQLMEDRYTEIERENRILLEKMSSIVNKKKSREQVMEHKSLNKYNRKEEMRRITVENHALLKRLQEKSPCYNSLQWEEDRKKTEKRLQNMCEFPYSLGRGGSTPAHLSRPRKLIPISKLTSYTKKLELDGEIYKVEIKRNKKNISIYIGKNKESEYYSLKLKTKEALSLMGNNFDYDKLISMLQIENGEIILIDNRDEEAEKTREKNNKSREGGRRKMNKDQLGMKNAKKLEEFENNKKPAGFSKNQDVSEEFYEDDSSENEPKAEKFGKSEGMKMNVEESGKISKGIDDKDEDFDDYDEESEGFKGTYSFQDEEEMRGSEGVQRFSDEQSQATEKFEEDEECDEVDSNQDD